MSAAHGNPVRSIGTVRSADGTIIALEQVSSAGPVMVMVPGATSDRRAWAGVAAQLADRFSCTLMDRRGKGGSIDSEPYALDHEYDDVAAAVSDHDQPVYLAGHSSGAICVLGAVARGLPVTGLVLYEPPWPVDGPNPGVQQLGDIEQLIADQDRDGALELALRVLVGLPAEAIAALRGSPSWELRTSLVHTWPREVRDMERLTRDLTHLAAITAPTLMLRGEMTPNWLAHATDVVAEAIPSALVVELPGQGHGALITAPHLVAEAIRTWSGVDR